MDSFRVSYEGPRVQACFYNVWGELLKVVPLAGASTPLPEVPAAAKLRLYSPLVDPPQDQPGHGPGCHCVSCIRTLCMSEVLDDSRVARRMLAFLAYDLERWQDLWKEMDAARGAQIRKRWKARKDKWRLRREILILQAVRGRGLELSDRAGDLRDISTERRK